MLAEAVEKLAKSSVYRYGDTLSFKVPITNELTLPGRFDPAFYCREFTDPGRVAVICPGNGGLAAQMFLNGASEVVLIEPRAWFHDSLKAVLKLFIEANPGKQIQVFTQFPTAVEHTKLLGKFDTIIWLEGVDDIGIPSVVHLVTGMLKPTGRMKVELAHGTSTSTSGKTNSWRPTPECWAEFVGQVATVTSPTGGRLGTTKTYMITDPKSSAIKTAPIEEPAPKPAPKPAPEPEPVVEPLVEAPKPSDVQAVLTEELASDVAPTEETPPDASSDEAAPRPPFRRRRRKQ